MNKINCSENIFPIFPLPCWKKTMRKKICIREKNESSAEYSPLGLSVKIVFKDKKYKFTVWVLAIQLIDCWR